LETWIAIHMERLAPLYKRKDGIYVTLLDRFEIVAKKIYEDESHPDFWNENIRKYREKLLGPDVIAASTPRYSELSARKTLGISPSEWKSMPLNERAELIAHLRLENMAEIIREDLREEKRALEERKRNVGKN